MRVARSLGTRLVLVTASVSSLILLVTLGYQYDRSRDAIAAEVEANARNLALSLVNRVEAELVGVTKVTEGIAREVAGGVRAEARLEYLLRGALADLPSATGAAVAFEPYAFRPTTRLYAPYVYRDGDSLRLTRLEEAYSGVEYPLWDWYQVPRELGRTEWSEPYFDDGASGVLMATCSAPILVDSAGTRIVRGIVTADLPLERLTELVSSVRILETGYAALLSRNGMLVAHPLRDAIMNETFFSIAEARGDTAMRSLGRRMIRGESDFVRYYSLAGQQSYVYFAPVASTGWVLAVVFPEAELYAPLNRMSLTLALIGGLGVLLLIAASRAIAQSVTGPLRTLAAATRRLADGDFDAPVPAPTTRDEVAALATDFRSMQTSLKHYIADLTATTAAKERIQSELRVATEIQASLLPRVFPPYPDRPEFDLFASMDPAKEVGGDFYDFFLVDADRLCVLIADVADKGVPAALYMMVTKTLLKTELQRLGDPATALANVNDVLAADNDRCMFATVFCAVLDSRTGEVRYANAGHNPPVHLSAGGAAFVPVPPGFMLGPLPGARYASMTMTLAPSETLFLYTDGVTESRSEADTLLGEEPLRAQLDAIRDRRPAEQVHAIRELVRTHQGRAEQSDDVTMLALTYRGREGGSA
jgi:phosphoserine phosphatase RsbU/P